MGAIKSDNYYYSKNLGDDFYQILVVKGINGDYPDFETETRFDVSSDIFDGGVLDFVAVSEEHEACAGDRKSVV